MVLDAGLFGQGLGLQVNHAWNALLDGGGYVLPSSAKVHCMPVELRTGEVSGFDLSPLDSYRWSPKYLQARLGEERYRILASAKPCGAIDFQKPVEGTRQSVSFRIEESGEWSAVAAYHELDLAGFLLSSRPETGPDRSVHQAVFYLPEPLLVEKGDEVVVSVSIREL